MMLGLRLWILFTGLFNVFAVVFNMYVGYHVNAWCYLLPVLNGLCAIFLFGLVIYGDFDE